MVEATPRQPGLDFAPKSFVEPGAAIPTMDAEDIVFLDVDITANDARLWALVLYGHVKVGYDVN